MELLTWPASPSVVLSAAVLAAICAPLVFAFVYAMKWGDGLFERAEKELRASCAHAFEPDGPDGERCPKCREWRWKA